jgi:hypothetical protein
MDGEIVIFFYYAIPFFERYFLCGMAKLAEAKRIKEMLLENTP